MRPLKYRAWNKKVKKMWSWEVMERNKVFALDSNVISSVDGFIVLPNHKDIKLMQWTGLKDRGGVEIYEGDILEFVSGASHQGINEFEDVGEVIWKWGMWVFQITVDEYCGLFEYYGHVTPKVVGNVFENPELLTKKEGGMD